MSLNNEEQSFSGLFGSEESGQSSSKDNDFVSFEVGEVLSSLLLCVWFT